MSTVSSTGAVDALIKGTSVVVVREEQGLLIPEPKSILPVQGIEPMTPQVINLLF